MIVYYDIGLYRPLYNIHCIGYMIVYYNYSILRHAGLLCWQFMTKKIAYLVDGQ